MSSEKPNNIITGPIYKGLFSLAIPIMIGFILQNVFNIVDMYFVGKLGAVPLAACSIGGLFIGLVYTFALGISTGTMAIVSRQEGEGDNEGAAFTGQQSVFLGIILYVVVAILGNSIIEPVLHLLGVDDNVFPLAVEYSRILLTGSFAIFIPMALNAYLRGRGDAVTPMRLMIMAALLNVVFDPIMIFGWLGCPKLGVAGSAYATLLARSVGMIYIIYHITFKAKRFKIKLLPVKIDFPEIIRILKIGVFGSLQSLLRNFSEVIMMKFVAGFGTAVIAAYGIGLRLRLTIMLPIMGLGVAAATMVGQNLGAKNPDRAEKSGWTAGGFSIIVMGAAAVLFFVFAEYIVSIFNQNPAVIRDGALFIRYYSPTFVFIGISMVMEKNLSGAGDTVSPMLMTLIGLYFLRIPVAYILQKDFGIEGLWMGIALSSVITGIIFIGWFLLGRWKNKNV